MIQSHSDELVEIVVEIAGLDQRGFFVGEESAGALLQGVLNALQRGRVAIRLPGNIQQQRRNARVGEMGGDARTHGARAEDRNTTNGSHGGQRQSSGASMRTSKSSTSLSVSNWMLEFARVRDPDAVTGMQIKLIKPGGGYAEVAAHHLDPCTPTGFKRMPNGIAGGEQCPRKSARPY